MVSCGLCVDETTEENPIFICVRCDVKVHKFCYGAEGSTANWKCSPCRLEMNTSIKCKLCQQKGGAMKRTECHNWVHVICSLFTKGVKISNEYTMEPINVSKVPNSLRNKICSFCTKKTGYCTKCTEKKCKKMFHVTCAQTKNTLKENLDADGFTITFEAYCEEHKPNSSCRRLSSGSIKDAIDKKRKSIPNVKDSNGDGEWILNSGNSHEKRPEKRQCESHENFLFCN